MKSLWLFCSMFIFCMAQQRNEQTDGNWIKKLRKELFENRHYDKNSRPVNHHHEYTEVDMQFSFIRTRVNEIHGTLETNGWLGLRWTDKMMTWDPDQFGGLQSLKLHSSELWTPDIVVYNSVRGYETMSGSHLVLLNNGIVYYIPPLFLVTQCELDLTYWPFDVQICSLRFGAWTHDSTEIVLGIFDNQTQADLKHYVQGGSSWFITETKAEVNSLQFDCCSPPYQDAVFTVDLKRVSSFDAKMALAPAAVVWLLVLVTFWMRPQCPERIHVGCVAILIMTILLIYFRMTLPTSGTHLPLVIVFHVTLLALSAMAVLVTLINSNLIRRNHPVPSALLCLVQGKTGSLLCTGSQNSLDSERALKANEEPYSETDSTTIMKSLTPTSGLHRMLPAKSSWYLVTVFIDRLAFLCYILIMTAIGLQYLLL